MKTISFEKKIHAPVEKVWETLWNDDTYREWTKHFMPGSHYESDWKIGGKTLFLDPDRNGMFATITKLEEPYEVIFNHQGELQGGVEGKTYVEGGSFEKYLLSESDGITTLTVSVDVEDEYEHDMNEGFTNGLEEVKRLAENK
ncbi:Uncharacterized conserved protein YndB, AHSA1/START domain [Porphyromonadaceae bacterium KH3R12]|nr:Uncharacterized conserved protein YndB, AHSA1/START domain [Porphyromonadaceae bacterium KH3R12]